MVDEGREEEDKELKGMSDALVREREERGGERRGGGRASFASNWTQVVSRNENGIETLQCLLGRGDALRGGGDVETSSGNVEAGGGGGQGDERNDYSSGSGGGGGCRCIRIDDNGTGDVHTPQHFQSR